MPEFEIGDTVAIPAGQDIEERFRGKTAYVVSVDETRRIAGIRFFQKITLKVYEIVKNGADPVFHFSFGDLINTSATTAHNQKVA